MEKIVCMPGLQHLAEKVFWNFDSSDLKICAQINQSCKQILQNPIFCLSKFEHLSFKNRKDWIKTIQSVKNSDKGIAIISYLQLTLEKDAMADLPCYSSPAIQDDFRKKIREICDNTETSNENIKIVKILAPLTDNLNPPGIGYFDTPMILAARKGHTEIIKILANLIDNPNAADENGCTPIEAAAGCGHTEIVKILVPFTDNPNAPNVWRETPIHGAAFHGHSEIVKFLASLTDNHKS